MIPLGYALLIHAAGAAADWYTTKRAVVDRDGKFREGNPIPRWFLSRWGEGGLAALMFGWIVVMVLLSAPPSAHVALGVLHLACAAWAVRLIRRAEK